MNADVQARIMQLEAHGAGAVSGMEAVDNNNAIKSKKLPSQEVQQATNLLNGTYVDRDGKSYSVDGDGNPVETSITTDNHEPSQSQDSYEAMVSVQNQDTLNQKAATAFESGDGSRMLDAIHDQVITMFAKQMDSFNSNPQAVWADVQAFAKSTLPNTDRKSFNEVIANGSGSDKQQAINNLLQQFNQHYFG